MRRFVERNCGEVVVGGGGGGGGFRAFVPIEWNRQVIQLILLLSKPFAASLEFIVVSHIESSGLFEDNPALDVVVDCGEG